MTNEPHWDSIGPPPLGLFALEQARAAGDLVGFRARRKLLRHAPRGDGHPVLVFPGFLAGDYSTAPLRRFLRDLCYDARGWKLGTNRGPNSGVMTGMMSRLQRLNDRHGRKLSLVGWSLGGIYARELARLQPQRVRNVVTLATPFGDIAASHASRLVGLLARGPAPHESEVLRKYLSQPLPVPATSIYSRSDGVVHWKGCLQDEGADRENIEVRCSHTGMGFNAEVLAIVADRLAQAEGEWQPYPSAPGEDPETVV